MTPNFLAMSSKETPAEVYKQGKLWLVNGMNLEWKDKESDLRDGNRKSGQKSTTSGLWLVNGMNLER